MLKQFLSYRITSQDSLDILNSFERLTDALGERPEYQPTGSQWRALGFGPVVPVINNELVFSGTNGCQMFALYIHERNLPGATIRKHVQAKAKKILETEQREKLYAKEMAQIRDEVVAELLPKSFIKDSRVDLLVVDDYLFIGASTSKKAEDALCVLREAMGSLSVRPLETKSSLRSYMGELMRGNGGDDFAMLARAKLTNEDGAVVTLKDVDLEDDEPQQYLDDGFLPSEMAIALVGDHSMNFVLTEKGLVKGVKFDELTNVQIKGNADGDAGAYFEGSLAIFVGTLNKFLDALNDVVGIVDPEITPPSELSLAEAARTLDELHKKYNAQVEYQDPELTKAEQEKIRQQQEEEDDMFAMPPDPVDEENEL